MWGISTLDAKVDLFFERSARALLSLLIVAILLAVLAGVLYTFYDLRLIVSQPFHDAFRTILVDILTVLAVVEMALTRVVAVRYSPRSHRAEL